MKNESENSIKLLHRIIKDYVKPYFKKIIFAAFFMLLVAITTAATVWVIEPALDFIFIKQNSTYLLLFPIAIIGISFIKGVASFFQGVIMKRLGQRIVTDIQLQLYQHLLHSDLDYLQQFSSGKLISRFTNDINIMRSSVSSVITGLVKELMTVIVLVIMMFYQNLTLSILCFVVFPLAVVPIIKIGRSMRRLAKKTQEELGSFTAKLDETFANIKVIRVYQQENLEKSKATELCENIYNLYARSARNEFISSPIMETMGGLAIAIVVWYGGYQVMNGETTVGTLFSFIAAFIMAYKPLKSLSDINNNLQEGLAAAKRLFTVLDTNPLIESDNNKQPLVVTNCDIEFQSVSFSYYKQKNKKVLDNLSFHIPAGKTVALVGPSGGGKSTICNLIPRFYDVTDGKISIDKQDIKTVSLKSLRENIALVSQEVMLYDDTIYNNIIYGASSSREIIHEEVVNAAKAAAAYDFIMALPEGFNTMVGQHGFKLSGGQRQRISIARAIIKNAPILLFDEATSALDNLSEKQIKETLAELRKGKTTLIIAHRLSTTQHADIIYVIKDGRLVEQGSHQKLLALEGYYHKLYSTSEHN